MQLPFYQPGIFKQFPEIVAAESTRHGGVSPIPYASLNLGINTEDKAEHIADNRRIYFDAIGWERAAFASSYQVHSANIMIATSAGQVHGYDAIITQQKDLLVGVTVADCCPILIYDAKNGVVAAIHAGWKGTVERIVLMTLQKMQSAFKTDALDCYAYVGTCISQSQYEVDDKVAHYFSSEHKIARQQQGKWLVDIRATNQDYLRSFGIPASQIEVSPFCTWINNNDYFSHRKEKGTTGRMLVVIGMKGK